MAHNERTSDEIASLAAELMHHPDPRVRRLAASTLTQAPDKYPDLQAEARAILAELDGMPPPLGALGAYAYYNAMAAQPSLGVFLRRRPADETIAGGWSSDNVMAKPTLGSFLEYYGRDDR